MTTAQFAIRAVIVAFLVLVVIGISRGSWIYGRSWKECMERVGFESASAEFCQEHSTD